MNKTDLLHDLDRWQARHHGKLSDLSPEKLFKRRFVKTYERMHDDLLWRVVCLHGTLFTLEQLEDFPFAYLYAPGQMEFWRLMAENSVEAMIVKLDGLLDGSGGVHSLRSFQNVIATAPWLDEEKCKLFRQAIRKQKFSSVIRDIEKRVRKLRDKHIAHRVLDRETGLPKEPLSGVTLKEFRSIFNATHDLFGLLSFGSSYVTLIGDLMPSTVGGKPTPTCLEDVMAAVLRDSSFVNDPERHAAFWPALRKHKDSETLRAMNEHRKRLGLPEA